MDYSIFAMNGTVLKKTLINILSSVVLVIVYVCILYSFYQNIIVN